MATIRSRFSKRTFVERRNKGARSSGAGAALRRARWQFSEQCFNSASAVS
jgi:hypothetical protein